MSEKMDRQGARTAADLERKYQFGKRFQEIMGLVDDTRGAISEVESNLQDKILEQSTSLTRDTESMIMTALKSYTRASELAELARTLRTEFEVSAGGISGKVSAMEKSIAEVNKDLQNKYNEITKFFTFDINGLLIGAIDEDGNPSPNKVVIDNDDITILVNNVPVQQFKADGTSLIPVLNVTSELKMCGLSVTGSTTHINIDFVG